MHTWGRFATVLGLVCALAASPAGAAASSWTTADIDGTRALVDVSCDFTGFCGAVDGSGQLLYSSAPAGAASWSSYQLGANSGAQTNAVSCYSAIDCAAVNDAGNAVVAENRSPWVQTSAPVDAGRRLTDISCVARGTPTQGFCAAVDDQGLVTVTDDPLAGTSATWSVPTAIDSGSAINAIACPSSSLCVAGDGGGRILVSSDPGDGAGATWTTFTSDSGHAIADVACVTVSPASDTVAICAVADASGRVLVSTNPAVGIWYLSAIASSPLTGISCASASMCVAVDAAGDSVASRTPGGSASTWIATHVAGHALRAVSCLQLGLQCSAVDDAGNVYTTTDALGNLGAGTPGVPTLASQTDTVSSRSTVRVRVTCHGTTTCQGTITLSTIKSRHSRAKPIGAASFSVQGGASASVAVRLNGTGKTLMRRRRAPVSVSAQLRFGKSRSTRTIRLAPAPRAHKH